VRVYLLLHRHRLSAHARAREANKQRSGPYVSREWHSPSRRAYTHRQPLAAVDETNSLRAAVAVAPSAIQQIVE